MRLALFVIALCSVAADPPEWVPPGAFDAAAAKAFARDLASPDFQAREQASAKLLAAGERALPAVRELLAGPPLAPEVKRRLEVVAERLALERLISPRRVTLKLENAPLKDALDELTRQTGYTFRTTDTGGPDVPAGKKISVACKDTPFLKALDLLCDDNDLAHFNREATGAIMVNAQATFDPVKTYAGPFRVTVTSASRSAQLQVAGRERRQPIVREPDRVMLQFTVESEPKNPMLGLHSVHAVSKVDERGHRDVLPLLDPAERSRDDDESRSFSHSAYIDIGPCDRLANSLKELTLKFTAILISESRVAGRVADITKAKGEVLTAGGVVATVTEVQVADDSFTVSVALRYSGPDSGQRNWLNLAAQRLRAVDGRNRELMLANTDTSMNGVGVATLQLVYSRAGVTPRRAPVALEFVEWRTHEQEVTVTLKDVPLP